MGMGREHHDWTKNGPGRALLWWPLISFLLMAVFPDAGIVPVFLAGAALALLGFAARALVLLLRRHLPEAADVRPVVATREIGAAAETPDDDTAEEDHRRAA
jgi:hypothetical protein